MIRALIPRDKEFSLYEAECRKLYEDLQDKICDNNDFDFIRENTYFYMFLDNNILIGGIYYFVDTDGKLFLNGFAKRKMHAKNLECLKMSTKWFNCDIYAEAQNRASALCLLKCGFKRVDKNIFKFSRNLIW